MEKKSVVGGHPGVIRFMPDGTLLKAGKKTEFGFFEDMNDPKSKYHLEIQYLKPHIPEFYGFIEEDGKKWIKMKNITYGFNNVSFMDIKMGDKTYSPDDNPKKIQTQIDRAKITPSFKYGFRITGLNIKDEKNCESYRLVKDFNAVTYEKSHGLINKFLMCNGKTTINKEAVKYYIETIKQILNIIETKTTRIMIGSSLLFALSNTDNKYDLKAIDFAHVFPLEEGGKDTGYIKGLKSLIELFEKFL